MGAFGLPALPGLENIGFQNPPPDGTAAAQQFYAQAQNDPSSPYYIPQPLAPARPSQQTAAPDSPSDIGFFSSLLQALQGAYNVGSIAGTPLPGAAGASQFGQALANPSNVTGVGSGTVIRFVVGIIGLLFIGGGVFMLSISGIETALNSETARKVKKGAALAASVAG